MSMLALGEWLIDHGKGLRRILVTYRLPSSKGNIRGVLDMLCRSGFSYAYLKVWTNRILPQTLRRRSLPTGVADFVTLLGVDVPVEPVESVNHPEIVERIRAIQPDYLVSFSATQRFGDPLIATPQVATVNVHYGALPAYAGLSPYFWHLYNQEPEFGVTLHKIVSKLDAGPIIEQTRQTTAGVHTCLGLALRMAECVSPLLCRLFSGKTDVANAVSQPATGRSYFRHPARKQVKEFQRNGFGMLDADSKQNVLHAVEALVSKTKV